MRHSRIKELRVLNEICSKHLYYIVRTNGNFSDRYIQISKNQKKSRIKPQENLNHCTFTFTIQSSRHCV